MAKITVWLLLILWLSGCVFQPSELELPIDSLTASQGKKLLNNQWRLTEVVYDDVQGEFDAIDPVLATFDADSLIISACNSAHYVFEAAGDSTKAYQLVSGVGTLKLCENGRLEQESFIWQALLATNDYELVGETLALFGEKARVTFVIDNDAAKLPD